MDVGQTIAGRYQLLDRLGAGGMSVVWRASDAVLGREVAVKVLSAEVSADPALLNQLYAEARAAAGLRHANVVSVYDYGEAAGLPYVVMELVEGRPVNALLSAGPLPWPVAILIAAQVAAALAAAHSRGIVHRDVKPANVMVTANGVKLVDFGISAAAGDHDGDPGLLLGTPAYLAPERLAGGLVRPATDVYALGLLLYMMLAGRLPWQASTTTEMLRAHWYQEPAPLPPVPGLPAEVAALCHRCLAKAPEDRPSAEAVAQALAETAGLPLASPLSTLFTAPATPERATEPPRAQVPTDVPTRVTPAASTEGVAAAQPAPAVWGPALVPSDSAGSPSVVPSAGHTEVLAGAAVSPAMEPEPSTSTVRGATASESTVPAPAAPGSAAPGATRAAFVPLALARLLPPGVDLRRPATRRTAVATAAALLVAAPAFAWWLTRPDGRSPASPAAAATPATSTQPIRCTVQYAVQDVADGRTSTALTLVNDGPAAVPHWRLSFRLPTGQQLIHGSNATWHQSGADVRADGTALAPGHPLKTTFQASYEDATTLPGSFTLNGVACRSDLSLRGRTTPPTTSAIKPAPPAVQPNPKPGDNQGKGPGPGNSGDHGKGKGKGKGGDD